VKFDLARSLRRIKPHQWSGSLLPRNPEDLHWAASEPEFGPALLLDTCVYIDTLEGRLPPDAEVLVKSRPLRHTSTVLAELAHLFGRLKHTNENRRNLQKLKEAIDQIDQDFVGHPSVGVSLEAGILCGLVFRLGGFQPNQTVAALNDALIYLHATEHGLTVLTRNRDDFDRMNQICPNGRVIFYEAS
jgi:predicted nucleic acid-binding protein